MSDNSSSASQSFAEKYAKKGNNSITSLLNKEKSDTIEPTAKNSPVASTNSSKADLIYLVKGVDNGRNAWYYVLVERLKLSLFLKALNDDIIHLENYGEILYSAYGDEPPQDITDTLKKQYDIK